MSSLVCLWVRSLDSIAVTVVEYSIGAIGCRWGAVGTAVGVDVVGLDVGVALGVDEG